MKFTVTYNREWADKPAPAPVVITADLMRPGSDRGTVEFLTGRSIVALVPLGGVSHIVSEADPDAEVPARLARDLMITARALGESGGDVTIEGKPFPWYLDSRGPLVEYNPDDGPQTLDTIWLPLLVERPDSVEPLTKRLTIAELAAELPPIESLFTAQAPTTTGTGPDFESALADYETKKAARPGAQKLREANDAVAASRSAAIDDADEAARAEQLAEGDRA